MTEQSSVVDDDAAILILADVILRRQRFDVTKVQNAFKALSLLGSMPPDLFVIDMMMPGMSGLELCQHIRLLPETANTPVIMVSAQTDPSVMANSAKVMGTSMRSARCASFWYWTAQEIQSSSRLGLPSIEQHSSKVVPASGS